MPKERGKVGQEMAREMEMGTENWVAPLDPLEWAESCVGRVGCVLVVEEPQRVEAEGEVRVCLYQEAEGTWSGQEGGPFEETVVGKGLTVALKVVGA